MPIIEPAYVVVGAGQAARWIVLTLRKEGYAGSIVWLGEEIQRPYDRPSLSKAVLLNKADSDAIALFSDAAFSALDVEWRPGQIVDDIDRERKCVRTRSGDLISYSRLFLATGGRARVLEGVPAHPRVHTLRTLDDALRLRASLGTARNILVLGGGWIGLEIAAAARSLGHQVTLVEAAPRLCIRSVPEQVSEYLYGLHDTHGVELRLGSKVNQVLADETGVSIRLDDGTTLDGDLLAVGVGMVPNVGLAAAAGLKVDNGIVVDSDCRTSDGDIFAAGDVANGLRADQQLRRLESWENAQRMGITAARAALGLPPDPFYTSPPWFWSDQYDDNLQILGVIDPDLQLIERNNPAKRQHIFYFCAGPRIRGVAAVNGGREIKIARKWLTQQSFPRLDDLVKPDIDVARVACFAAQ